ncbi:MAG: hypothetical protein CW691_09495 [Candidatus Bathyarchaeum sp.]|nr:MAG: hypothetical protein CW691_09495 [Candidatus Bathyarchaeum sp.]
MPDESLMSKFEFLRSMPNLIIFALFVSAAIVLAWVGQLALTDMSVWNKDLGSILFGSRTGESISLGIGMALIHYVLIGVSLFAAGVVLFLRNRILAVELPQDILMKSQKVKAKNQTKSVKTGKYATKEENAAASEDRFFSGCLHHFGYLSSRPKDSPIPQECIICQRLGDCMVATVYVKKVNK